MRTIDYGKLAAATWDGEILADVAAIHEHKGRQELFLRQKPVELDRLVKVAMAQSTEASNRIEGIVTTSGRLKQLIDDKTAPRNRDESEILGYRNVLATIHENYDFIPLTSNYILQLHRDLLRHTALSYGGKFKAAPNEIDSVALDGTRTVLFRPVSPADTPRAVELACASYNETLARGFVDPLILIACFTLDFLCIHPFSDGNGRMSRLLTLLLLYRSGYLVGRYVSVEKAIADSKEDYYDALDASDQGWHDEANDPTPYIKYFLGVLLGCYREFEERTRIVAQTGTRSTAYDIVRACVLQKVGTFSKQDVLVACPSLGSSSVESALKRLVEEGALARLGKGRATRYVRGDALLPEAKPDL